MIARTLPWFAAVAGFGAAAVLARHASKEGKRRPAKGRRHLTRSSAADASESAPAERLEVSALAGDHPLAAAPDVLGAELADPDAVEVPVGQSADPAIDFSLSHEKLSQPDSTGSALREPAEPRAGSLELTVIESTPIVAVGEQPSLEVTRIVETPMSESRSWPPILSEQAYDSILPEDLGSEWLTRFTEAPPFEPSGPRNEVTEVPSEDEPLLVSEASSYAAGGDKEALLDDLHGFQADGASEAIGGSKHRVTKSSTERQRWTLAEPTPVSSPYFPNPNRPRRKVVRKDS